MDDSILFDGVDILDIIPLIAIAVAQEAPNHSNKLTSSREGILSGSDYLNELLNCGNKIRIYSILRMKRSTFLCLCLWFRKKGLLQDSRNTSIEQQVAQFLWIINFSASTAQTAERFRVTKEPVSRYFEYSFLYIYC